MRLATAKKLADKFNAENPVGTPIEYFEVMAHSPPFRTTTRSEAATYGSGNYVYAIIFIDGKSGWVSLEHCKVIRVE